MTSVKPGVRLSIAAPFAGLQNSRSGSRPVPWSTCSQTHEGSSLGCPRHRRRRPDKSSQAGVGPISGQGYLGAAPAPATGPKGWRGGPDSPSPAETPSPPPLSPASSQKGSGGGGRSGISRPTPLGCSPQGWYLRGSFHLRRYIPALALSLVIAPKGRSCPFKRQRAAATHPPSGNYARGGEVGFPADSFPVPLRAPAAPLSALPSSAKPGRGREGWTGAAPLRGAASPPPGWGQGAGTGPLRPAAGTSGRAPRRPGCAPGGGGGAAPARVLTAPTGCPRPRRWLRPARHSPWLAGSARARAPTRIPRRRRR